MYFIIKKKSEWDRSIPSIFTVENIRHVVVPYWKKNNRAFSGTVCDFQRADLNETSLPTYVPVILQLMYPQTECSLSSRS